MSGETDQPRLQAEQQARAHIDRQLRDAGWFVQDRADLNLFAGPGIAVREAIMAAGHGRADYLLYVDQRVVGAIEAKPIGTTLSGVEWQSAMYVSGLPAAVRLKALTRDDRLPFAFEASGSETHFTNGYDPQPRARRIFAFPKPETLARIIRDAEADPHRSRQNGSSPRTARGSGCSTLTVMTSKSPTGTFSKSWLVSRAHSARSTARRRTAFRIPRSSSVSSST